MLSIIIPVYNEESYIKKVVESVLSLEMDKEIIVVDDGSTDSTFNILEFSFQDEIKIVRNPRNYGKGYAIRQGLNLCEGDIVAFQDADYEYPPENLSFLYRAFKSGNFDSVIGVRTVNWDYLNRLSIGSIVANRIIHKLSGLPDVFSGQRIIKRKVLENLDVTTSGFDIETEITLKLLNSGYRIKWEPIKYYPRTRKEGKKIGAFDFFAIMYKYLQLRKEYKKAKKRAARPVESGNVS